MTRKITPVAFGVAASLLIGGTAFAQDIRVTQSGKKFSEAEVNIAPGQKVVFVNDDSVAHNVYTIVKGKKLDLGLQKPSEEGEISFDQAGTYRVRCAIHPRMKMVVKVEE